jgi:nucleotide-binding universal stress UspA family protein
MAQGFGGVIGGCTSQVVEQLDQGEMMMIANILVPLDGSPLAERALPYATSLARAAQARLRLLHAIPDTTAPAHSDPDGDVAARLEHLASQLRTEGVQATAQTITGRAPSHAIVDAANDPPADLIAMSTHGRSGLGRWLYGSVADQVLTLTEVPVLLISAACHHAWTEDRPLKILVPLDGSDHSETALRLARVLGDTLGAGLLLLRVVDEAADTNWRFDPSHVSLARASSAEIEQSEQYLQGLAEVPSPSTQSIDLLVDTGNPSSTITTVAENEGVDLIVMATHGRTGLARLTMGSVAIATLHRAHVPILLIRPPGLERPKTGTPQEASTAATSKVWPPLDTR